ncbi:MAG: hypothetical protein JW395_3328 [Nitrospira sp.]|nr:hypothetical protein [Nitrospira sp.]
MNPLTAKPRTTAAAAPSANAGAWSITSSQANSPLLLLILILHRIPEPVVV